MTASGSPARAMSSVPATASTPRSTVCAEHAGAVFHTHMPFASALTRLKDQRILPIGQTEVAIAMHTAYDDSYGGPAFDPAEGERLAGLIGNKKILMMANHGVATITPTISEAYDLLYYTERAAQVQILRHADAGASSTCCRSTWSTTASRSSRPRRNTATRSPMSGTSRR